ncbi:HAD family hydrolase [Haloarcula salinisoli]|uniref:HAD family hydrolase n=1 Tax=Haloarcula salinisoli TaxID=2487746 RepID=A0A8J7YMT4_9EURY|nr:HAD family hydrolase [Halomicroarcula salinisoli]MBX0287697.1 HAD family hydrolase [Halomicroarcula salinisoli]MBX0304626.1 HAD family hydrolase [Halomicroarcula salinisoli]
MTEALCFALDGVLVHRTRSDADILRDVFDAHGVEPSDEVLTTARDAFRDAFENLEPDPYRQSMAAVRSVADTADSDADPDEMVATLRERTYAGTTVPDAARESLAGLAEDSALAVITNGPREWQVGKLDHHGLTDQFDAVVASYEAGAHKPDTAPFELLRERLPADEYVMVGDSEDVEGARAAGFVPIEYRTDGPDLWATIDALL